MATEKFFLRFHLIMVLFIFSMIFLIFSSNIWFSLIGWDGLGLTSFLLVTFYGSANSLKAGFLTVMSNRVGDACLIICICLLASQASLQYFSFSRHNFSPFEVLLLCVLFFSAACSKSAQLPFSAWLPAAMAAPTPVSALVHSSTLVTAGIYLLGRNWTLLEGGSLGLVSMIVALLTMIIAGLTALLEEDMKKMIALSTLSQLGFMLLALSFKAPELSFLHLISHAFFKALLFMSVGQMIHNSSGYQDSRASGFGPSESPAVFSLAVGCKMSLCGLPFMSGYFSKDFCLEWAEASDLNWLTLALTLFALSSTLLYSLRFIYILFNSGSRSTGFKMTGESAASLKAMFFLIFAALHGSYFLWGWIDSSGPLTHYTIPLPTKFALLAVATVAGLTALLLSRLSPLRFKTPKPLLSKILGLAEFSGWHPNLVSRSGSVNLKSWWDNFWVLYMAFFFSVESFHNWKSRLGLSLANDVFLLSAWTLLFFLFW